MKTMRTCAIITDMTNIITISPFVLLGVVKSLEPLNAHLIQEVHMLTKNSEGQVLDGLTKVIHSRVGLLPSVIRMTP